MPGPNHVLMRLLNHAMSLPCVALLLRGGSLSHVVMLTLLLSTMAASGCRPSDPAVESPPVQPAPVQPAAVEPEVVHPAPVHGSAQGSEGTAQRAAQEEAPAPQPQPGQPAAAAPAFAAADPAPVLPDAAIEPEADPSAGCGAVTALPKARGPATLDLYKHDLACRIHARNAAQIYQGAPPPVLRSVVVLTVRIDAAGRPVRIAVRRSNGIRDLERRAIQSVRLAAPLPVPSPAMLRQGSAEITETWLFRDDGRFQVRSLAMVQAKSGY